MQDDDFGDFSSAFPSDAENQEWGFSTFSTADLPPITSDGTFSDIPPLPEGLDFDITGGDGVLSFTTVAQSTSSLPTESVGGTMTNHYYNCDQENVGRGFLLGYMYVHVYYTITMYVHVHVYRNGHGTLTRVT